MVKASKETVGCTHVLRQHGFRYSTSFNGGTHYVSVKEKRLQYCADAFKDFLLVCYLSPVLVLPG